MASSTGDARGSWRRDPAASVGRTYPVPADTPAAFTIVAESHVVGTATEWEPHVHPAHELVWVRHGTLTARAGGQVFTVSEGFGLWVPAPSPPTAPSPPAPPPRTVLAGNPDLLSGMRHCGRR